MQEDKNKTAHPRETTLAALAERGTRLPSSNRMLRSFCSRGDFVTNSAIVGERPATGSTTERTHGHTYLDGVRVQRAGVVSPNVVLVASSAEDAPTNQANPEVVGCLALLRICGHAPGERKNRHKSGVREAYTSQLPTQVRTSCGKIRTLVASNTARLLRARLLQRRQSGGLERLGSSWTANLRTPVLRQ